VTRAILRGGFAPALILSEFNQWTPPPIEFAALEPRRGDVLNASYAAGWRGASRRWPCDGASLSSWLRLAQEHGYVAVQLDRVPTHANVLLMRADVHTAHYAQAWSTDLIGCHLGIFRHWQSAGRLIPLDEYGRLHGKEKVARLHELPATEVLLEDGARGNGSNRTRWRLAPPGAFNFAPALRVIDDACTRAQTPYLLRLHSVCCPQHNRSSTSSRVGLCRAGCSPTVLRPLNAGHEPTTRTSA
jgi:hypothetical protein